MYTTHPGSNADREEAPRQDHIQDIVRSKVENLRARLLDSSRRNPLIQIPFRQNSSSLVRFVDEMPDILAERLGGERAMRLKSLPPIDEPLPDEQTDDFLDALEIARSTDEIHLTASAALDPSDPDYAQKELDLERALKDRVRAELGLPERQTEQNPSLAEHARAHGISPNFVLPTPDAFHADGRHDDWDIQTLLLPEQLDRIGRLLHDKAHAFERETGVNVLHAVFGILEWNEPGSSRPPARSPLLLLEIRMERKKALGGVEYRIRGENGLSINTTLAQALSAQFGLELPAFDGGSVEDYFAAVSDLAPKGWHWSLRREALAGIFPSSRIAMYRDLDPESGRVTENPLIASMLASTGGDGASYAEVYDTDAPEIEARVPRLVMDADASQFSTLVDVAQGANVAIEGPPGSGKSQTIVNLIASALADGKKVLFVAEKLTALEVVKNRLDSIGLGAFILPLQAGRGSRDAVFQSLAERLELAHPPRGSSEVHKERHAALVQRRSDMQAYLDMLGSEAGSTGMSVHEVLGHAIATAEHLDGLPREVRRLRIEQAHHIGPDARAAIIEDARMVVERLESADRIASLWRDAGAAPLRTDEAEDIASGLTGLASAITAFRDTARESNLAGLLPDDPVLADAEATLEALHAIAANSDTDPDLVELLLDEGLRASAHEVCEVRDQIAAATGRLRDLLGRVGPGTLYGEDALLDHLIDRAAALASRHDGAIDPEELAEKLRLLEGRQRRQVRIAELARALPARWADLSADEHMTLSDLQLDIERLLRAPAPVLALRRPDDARTLPALAREAARVQRELAVELEKIRRVLPKAGTHPFEALEAAATTLENAGAFRLFSGAYKSARTFWREYLGGDPKTDRKDAAATIRTYARWTEKVATFANETRFVSWLDGLFKGLETDPELLEAAAAFHETAARISGGNDRLRYAIEAGPLDPLRAFVAEDDIPAKDIREFEIEIEDLGRHVETLRADLEEARSICLSFGGRATVTREMIEDAREARNNIAQGRRLTASARAADALAGVEDTDAIRAAILVAARVAALPKPGAGIDLLRVGRAAPLVEEGRDLFERLGRLSEEARSVISEFAPRGVDLESPSQAIVWLAERLGDVRDATARPEGLVERARLLRALSALQSRGLGALTVWVQTEEGMQFRDRLPDIVAAILARSLTDHVEATHGRTLDARDGADLDRLRREIAKIDDELKGRAQSAIREELVLRSNPPRGIGTGKVGHFTDMSLIRHELSKVRNRIGVRDLTARAGAALVDLKPCWMMSPLAVAQYLHGNILFDLVVIDEASQMTPENALGAIMRGRQVVVVGDTKQLPPTSFFSKILDDADEDEDARTDSESILDIANATFMPVRQLRWHYRSRHPDLIAISNRMIYDEKLTIFPAARDGDPSFGLELVEVEGEYRKGRNIPEARAIVAGAIAHMRDHPHRSLGLATMNRDQTELILSEFERERARHPHVEAYIEYWSEKDDGLEEFFVKNLETIQGDERDVIMISTLYGRDPETGKVYQRFGPVNSVHGHRRLNVLFSRAKEKVVTYTSMKPTDIQVDGKAYGVAVLRSWLEFSRTGQIGDVQTGQGRTDSPFEDYVIAQIEAAGYEAVPQVGASGFRIDIGVRHPDWPYGFILAVECDGAPYHSSRSSRDRDRLRQQVLEGLGWHFHRIWSTDWFRDPKAQIARLRTALDAALERAKRDESRRHEERNKAVEAARKATLPTAVPDSRQGSLFDTASDHAS
jgi:RecA/RadA recombinase